MKLNIEQRESDEFGLMLYRARIDRGEQGKPLPMRKAAHILDTTEATYGTWEKGHIKPTIKPGEGLVQRLAFYTSRSELDILVALDVLSPDALGGRDSNPQPIDYQSNGAGKPRHLHSV